MSKPPVPREAEILKSILEYLRLKGIPHYRMQSGAVLGKHKGKTWAIKLNPPGTPDILCHTPAVLWIEVKRPGQDLRPEQAAFADAARWRGERFIVAHSLDDVMAEV